MTTYKLITAASLAAALVTGGHATADDNVMIVRMSDLNVSSHEGARAALRRIEAASALYCSPQYRQPGPVSQRESIYRCKLRMTEKAVAALDAPRVTALYAPQSSLQLARR